MPLILQLAILALLVLLNGAFAMAELALVSARRAMLTLMERQGLRGATRARLLADDPQSFLPTTQFGITLIGILTGVFGGAQLGERMQGPLRHIPYIAAYAAPLGVAFTVLAITFLTLVFGELVPKQLALRHPERLAVLVAGPIAILARIAGPAIWLLSKATHLVLRVFGPTLEDRRGVSEEELKAMLVEGAESGVLENEERDIIERVLRLADKPVRAIMTPRTEIVWVDRSASREDIIARLRAASHSRFVVCDGSVDNVTGIILAKDVLDRVLDNREGPMISPVLRQPMAIPDSVSALDALDRLKADELGMALVFDEYGSFEGVVTAADVLEAIVGDAEDTGPSSYIEPPPDSFYELDGLTPVDEIKARLHLPALPNEGSYHTLGGLILALLLRPAAKGDAIIFGGWKFEVLAMDGRRIDRVKVAKATGD
ncbi:MAG: hemolysin family protein [Rhodospirillales bacterium]|nr:hemolysin family protein [Rhodospirillales bacterium]MDE2319950.1 HlyC/CorC family transporter [Rhodospirillales bacterium]